MSHLSQNDTSHVRLSHNGTTRLQPSHIEKPRIVFSWPPLLFLLVAAAILLLDHITKWCSSFIPARGVGFPGLISLKRVVNTGAAFSLGDGQNTLFIIIALVIVLLIGFYVFKFKPQRILLIVSCALIAGGAVGNALSRFLSQGVIDFISLDLIHFPIFNVADIAITCGFLGFIVYILHHGFDGLFSASKDDDNDNKSPQPGQGINQDKA